MSLVKIKNIGVFCGSSLGNEPLYCEATKELAKYLVDARITLVYGGANVGLMGLLADHILKNNGEVIGVIPKSLVDKEVAHPDLTKLHIVNSMHERKAMMEKLSDGFIMLPGGAGSLDEFFEMVTWAQLGFHSKPCGILNIGNYYDSLLTFLDHVVEKGFMKLTHRNMIIVENSPQILFQKLGNYQVALEKKWFDYSLSLTDH